MVSKISRTNQHLTEESSLPKLKNKIEMGSFQNVLFESLDEAKRAQQGLPESNLLFDTIKEIGTAASLTIASIREWSEKQQETNSGVSTTMSYDDQMAQKSSNIISRSRESRGHERSKSEVILSTFWGFHRGNSSTGISEFADQSTDEDDYTVETLDTAQAENNQIRRLGSWNTVNTTLTSETYGPYHTGENSEAFKDDDGNIIDQKLLQKAKESRSQRKVKFQYPPVKSMRTVARPDPESLPNLFFTEEELNQIEGDRYSTMSTDDIEIIAVTKSQEEDRASSPLGSSRHSKEEERENERDRTSSSRKKGRLVKGVQIFLRDRSS